MVLSGTLPTRVWPSCAAAFAARGSRRPHLTVDSRRRPATACWTCAMCQRALPKSIVWNTWEPAPASPGVEAGSDPARASAATGATAGSSERGSGGASASAGTNIGDGQPSGGAAGASCADLYAQLRPVVSQALGTVQAVHVWTHHGSRLRCHVFAFVPRVLDSGQPQAPPMPERTGSGVVVFQQASPVPSASAARPAAPSGVQPPAGMRCSHRSVLTPHLLATRPYARRLVVAAVQHVCQPRVRGVPGVTWRWFLRGSRLCVRADLPGLMPGRRRNSHLVRGAACGALCRPSTHPPPTLRSCVLICA